MDKRIQVNRMQLNKLGLGLPLRNGLSTAEVAYDPAGGRLSMKQPQPIGKRAFKPTKHQAC